MSLNKSDRNYIILILVVLISVLSMKVRPIKFRLVLKAINLVFLLVFLYKRDFKISLFLALLLFSLNQNGIGNSVDFFQNQTSDEEDDENNKVAGADEAVCFLKCYQEDDIKMEECDSICSNFCKAKCASELSEGASILECNEMCDARENFQNSNESNASNASNTVTTTTQREPLESNERGCRIKCLQEDYIINDCKEKCTNKCYNTCTESNRTFVQCQELCGR